MSDHDVCLQSARWDESDPPSDHNYQAALFAHACDDGLPPLQQHEQEHAWVLAGWYHPELPPVTTGPLLRAALARPTREFDDD